MSDLTAHLPQALALLQVILIDVSLSGDNAIIIALAANGLPVEKRGKAIAVGIGAAVALRIAFASAAVYVLAIPGLILLGGLLLAWVCVKMWRELRADAGADGAHLAHEAKTLWQAVVQITIADVSMSLDNVLAVAGAARDHLYVMVFGLALSIALMAVAARAITGLLTRWPWLKYAALALIAFVAASMIVNGIRTAAPSILALLGS
jgi:YjbE family integral membrane protein